MATNNASNIPTGTSGTILQGQGAGVALELSTATYPATTTANQLLYSSATNTVAGLANGTTGQVLTATTGSAPSWATTAGGGGSWVYISSATAAASAEIVFDAGLTDTYDQYMITITNAFAATDGVYLAAQTSANGGVTYDSGATDYVSSVNLYSTTTIAALAASYIRITPTSSYTIKNTYPVNCTIYIESPSYTGDYSTIHGTINFSYTTTSGGPKGGSISCTRLSVASFDAIRFYMSSGNITSGVFRLYGLKTS